MLGRLHMSLEQAIKEYGKLVERAFSDKRSFGMSGPGAYKGKNLREALQSMVQNATGNKDERMVEGKSYTDGCKT